uniref:hypothetical protein n=2 Tax=Mycoplasmopsis primatum TaxID=55604 RepID=UPI000496486B
MKKTGYIILKIKRKDFTYVCAGISNGFNKGTGNQIGLGKLEDLERKNENAIDILKKVAREIDINQPKEKVKQEL